MWLLIAAFAVDALATYNVPRFLFDQVAIV